MGFKELSKIILLDQDCQHYRLPVYKEFRVKLKEEMGYELIIGYDKELNSIDNSWSYGINYSYRGVTQFIKNNNPLLIIHNFWLRYPFVFPFLLYCKINGIKNILWTHGINLQNKNQIVLNAFYYLRQYLADALIIYSREQKQFIKPDHKKLFIANNTLNFKNLPLVSQRKDELKEVMGFKNKFVILCVGRMNNNNRKVEHLLELEESLNKNFAIILIGPGVNDSFEKKIEKRHRIQYLGPIYNQEEICKYYKMADLFCMPGAIGLAINQAFFFETPVVVEKVDQGPEAIYLKEGYNGYYYEEGNIDDLLDKIFHLQQDKVMLSRFSKNAKKTIKKEGSLEVMFQGFRQAIEYVKD